MNESDGVVVRVEGGYAWVKAAGPGHACGACASRDGCVTGGNVLDAAGKPHLLKFPNAIRARPGDAVVIRAADGTILSAIWLAYGLPLLLALLLAGTLLHLTASEPAAFAGMLFGLAGGFLLLRRRKTGVAREPNLSIAFKNVFWHS